MIKFGSEKTTSRQIVPRPLNDFVVKGDLCDHFISLAVDAALKGDVVISPRFLSLLLEDYFRLLAAERTGGLLTPREARIAKLISRGMSNKEIANEISLSVRTVENIRYGMMKKI